MSIGRLAFDWKDFLLLPSATKLRRLCLDMSVILFTGGMSASVHAGIPPGADPLGSRHSPPWDQAPPWADTPGLGTPSRDQTAGTRHSPLRKKTPLGTRHYWNVFLFTGGFSLCFCSLSHACHAFVRFTFGAAPWQPSHFYPLFSSFDVSGRCSRLQCINPLN